MMKNNLRTILRSSMDNELFDIEAAEEYLKLHDLVGKEFFLVSGHAEYFSQRDDNAISKEEHYYDDLYNNFTPLPVESFLKKLQIYFYVPEMSRFKIPHEIEMNVRSSSLAELLYYIYNDMELYEYYDQFTNDTVTFIVDQIYEKNKNLGISLCDMFAYIKSQSLEKERMGLLFYDWLFYLDLCEKHGIEDYFPDRFITSYNLMRQKEGLQPIIYMQYEEYESEKEYSMFDKIISFEGRFPCDKEGNPYMDWIGIKVLDPESITCTCRGSNIGRLEIKISPKTQIFILRDKMYHTQESALEVINKITSDINITFTTLPEFIEYLCSEKGKEFEKIHHKELIEKLNVYTWERVYAGPYFMEFNASALKLKRKELKYTQAEVADAIGAAVRTYQKWENGESTPDGHYFMRLMGWLGINNIQDLASYRSEPCAVFNAAEHNLLGNLLGVLYKLEYGPNMFHVLHYHTQNETIKKILKYESPFDFDKVTPEY